MRLVLCALVLLVAAPAAIAAPAADPLGTGEDGTAPQAAQEQPEEPGGEPQPGGEPEPPDEPVDPVTGDQPAAEELPGVPGGGELPRTGSDALWLALLGILLLLAGARLRVLTRLREVRDRVVARYRRPEVELRESLERLRVARMEPTCPADGEEPPLPEPSTPGARRVAKV